MDLTEAEVLRGGKNTENNYKKKKKNLHTQVTTVVWSLT